MPITEFQRTVLLLLKKHRHPDSYVAGGIAIHRAAESARYSNDIDFFHDTDEAVRLSAEADISLLSGNGYDVRLVLRQPSITRAVISRRGESLRLEWVRDTAFRFFPVVPDEDLGFRLHDADLAVNKCLALANRNEVRDIIDLLQIHETVLSLPAVCWAACGKDPGFTPTLLLDLIRRHSIIRPEQLSAELVAAPISPVELKQKWFAVLDPAMEALDRLPSSDLGCLYLDAVGKIVKEPKPDKLSGLRRHFGSIGGSWPRLID